MSMNTLWRAAKHGLGGRSTAGAGFKASTNAANALGRGARAAGLGIRDTAMGRHGGTAAGALYGGSLGAGWGMASDDTSVIGGAMLGAGMGAVGGRYGTSAVGSALQANKGAGAGFRGTLDAVGGGLKRQGQYDYQLAKGLPGAVKNNGAELASNSLNKMGNMLKGWGDKIA